MLLLKCILLATFLVIILQCDAYSHDAKSNQKKTPLSGGNDESKINDKNYHNRDDKPTNSGDSFLPPVGAIEIDDVTETTEFYYDETTSDYEAERDQSLDCILAQSQFYLSWWVNEDGSLRMSGPRFNSTTNGILDLSLYFSSEDAIYNHVLSFTTTNPGDVSFLIFSLN